MRVLLDREAGEPVVRSAGGQGSHVLQALADANALAYVPGEVTRVRPGQVLDIHPVRISRPPGGGRGGAAPGATGSAGGSGLTHVRAGSAHMVDVSAKAVTARRARAAGRVLLAPAAVAALRDGTVPKGDALAVARIAGLQAAKRTPDLVPLAHRSRCTASRSSCGSPTTASTSPRPS